METADGLAKKGTDKRLQARIESSLGAVYMLCTNPDDAEGLLTKSLGLARGVGDAHLEATALNNLANLHAYQKNNDQALQEYEEGIVEGAGQRRQGARGKNLGQSRLVRRAGRFVGRGQKVGR